MRTRSWRRYKEELIVIKRLKKLNYRGWYHYAFSDANGIRSRNPLTLDFIGTRDNFRYKTNTSDNWSTNNNEKYSPNKRKGYWRSGNHNGTREYDRKEFLNILREHGLK